MLLILFGNSSPGIENGEDFFVPFSGKGNRDLCARFGIFKGVVQQNYDELADCAFISGKVDSIRDFHSVGFVRFKGKAFKGQCRGGDGAAEIKVGKGDGFWRAVQTGKVEQVPDEQVHTVGLLEDVLQPFVFPETVL